MQQAMAADKALNPNKGEEVDLRLVSQALTEKASVEMIQEV